MQPKRRTGGSACWIQHRIKQMTIEQSKTQLISLIDNVDLKVVALTGAWGTGKTHLWNEIRKESQDPIVAGARYVSLFGLKDINQLKLKVVQSALPVGSDSSSLTEGLMKTWKVSVDALKKVHEGFSALDELALVAVPVALRNRFVVVDDIERKHASLSVDEVLGFVDEYSQNFGTRFLLILNSDRFSAPTDSALWAAFREKVVEEELRFTPTPERRLTSRFRTWIVLTARRPGLRWTRAGSPISGSSVRLTVLWFGSSVRVGTCLSRYRHELFPRLCSFLLLQTKPSRTGRLWSMSQATTEVLATL